MQLWAVHLKIGLADLCLAFRTWIRLFYLHFQHDTLHISSVRRENHEGSGFSWVKGKGGWDEWQGDAGGRVGFGCFPFAWRAGVDAAGASLLHLSSSWLNSLLLKKWPWCPMLCPVRLDFLSSQHTLQLHVLSSESQDSIVSTYTLVMCCTLSLVYMFWLLHFKEDKGEASIGWSVISYQVRKQSPIAYCSYKSLMN